MNNKYIQLNNEIMQKKSGFFQLDKDKEATKEFANVVHSKMKKFNSVKERFTWLIENNYYENFLKDYSIETIEKLVELVYSYEFEFQSYMAISKFYNDYALKTNDKEEYLEYYEDRIVAVALYLAQGSEEDAENFVKLMITQQYQPATPTFLNAGKARRGEMISCFLLEMDDTLNSIAYNLSTSMQLSKIGGGVAVNLSKLRARNEPIKGIEGAASGVLPVLKLMEDSFSYVDQLGQRSGAGAAYLNIFHWDVEEFLDTKKINADEKSRIQTLSIGLVVPFKFFELARENKPYYVFAPYSVYEVTGKHLDDLDIDELYEELISHPDIKKKELDARKMLINIAKMQFESGYPYLVFKTNANKEHALKNIGSIKMSNLCTEIFQLQETSTITDYGEPDIIRRDINCNLGSLNIVNVMEHKDIETTVRHAMTMLTSVSTLSDIKNAPGVNKANAELRSVGLGAMNLHAYLTKSDISYESDLAKEFVRTFFMLVNYYSILASSELAEKYTPFEGFKESTYYTGEYFTKYFENDYSPKSEKVVKLFEGIEIPDKEKWKQLAERVKETGLYHAYRLAIAPTQSIGYVQNATPSILPVVDLIERRTYGNATTYYPMPYLSPRTIFLYKSAYNMDMLKMLDLIREAQEHVDQGISTTLYVDSNTSTKELVKYYLYAHKIGLKSLYYTRTKNLAFEECLTCSI